MSFVTNIEEQIEPVKLNVGQKIKIPKLSNKDKIFIGWYTNAELTNKFGNDNLKDSITLYAKWENAEKVINESEKKPITDKDVSDQVEKILNERFKELKEGQTNTEKPNESTNKETTGTTEKPKDNNNDNKGAAATVTNNQKSDTNNTKDNTKTNNSNTNPLTSNPWEGSVQNDTKLKENAVSNSNKITSYTETKYVFKNKNIGEKYMVKFLDESGAFVSSLTLPYGRTIKLLDENEIPHEEYAVRQDTTINLNTERYINKGSTFLGLDTRTVQVNATEITEIYPTTVKNNSNSFLYKKDEKNSQKEDSNNQNIIIALSIVSVICIILGIFVLFKKRKKKEKDQEQNINM
ncbi:InlB B-repeat-containing protein [Bacillus paranthracis]|uniref:InlB B-repeat-containing protein n=1 Tax=Bacillus paranthracis TaxID=2026186 RepID=UPI003D64AAD8